MSDTFTGRCAICYRPFSECECKWNVEPPDRKREVADLVHTIKQHCKIAQILLTEGKDGLLPSVLEDIFYFVQDLPEHFIEEEVR